MRYFYDLEFHEDGRIVDPISIGIVAEDGRTYYAINADADWHRISAHPWLPDNVLAHLPGEWAMRPVGGLVRNEWRPDRQHKDVKVREQIAEEVAAFLTATSTNWRDNELWGYYSAYDHVALCQLFGRMIDLPRGVPMWTNDLQQVVAGLESAGMEVERPAQSDEHHALADARWNAALFAELGDTALKQALQATRDNLAHYGFAAVRTDALRRLRELHQHVAAPLVLDPEGITRLSELAGAVAPVDVAEVDAALTTGEGWGQPEGMLAAPTCDKPCCAPDPGKGDPDMQTPHTPGGLRVYDDLPADVAAARAWTEPGTYPAWHRMARLKVTGAMPVLARALDRLTGTVAVTLAAAPAALVEPVDVADHVTIPASVLTALYERYSSQGPGDDLDADAEAALDAWWRKQS